MPRRPLPDNAWKILGLVWLAGIALYGMLVLIPAPLPLMELTIAGGVKLGEVMHFLAFLLLAGSFPLAFPSRVLVITAPVALVLLNVVLEFAQMHIPNRRFSELDVLAGVLGCLAGTVLGGGLRLILRRRQR